MRLLLGDVFMEQVRVTGKRPILRHGQPTRGSVGAEEPEAEEQKEGLTVADVNVSLKSAT